VTALSEVVLREVPAGVRAVAGWDPERLLKEAESAADVIAGGADGLFAGRTQRGGVTAAEATAALVRGLSILALRADGVTFAGLTFTADGDCTGTWSIPDHALIREARGAFFTPRAVAEMITAGALGPLTHQQPVDRISDLRVADIACGAGAFLLAATRFLADELAMAWSLDEDVLAEALDTYDTDDVRTAARREVLDLCIHGVDLDPLSVELAKIAVQLLIPTSPPPMALRAIRCGDSLIGHGLPGWHDNVDYPPGAARFDWPTEFPAIFPAGRVRDAGFDAIIGNPPYLGGQRITGQLGTAYREHLVDVLAEGRRGSADLAAYFWIRAVELCHETGVVGLIATNTLVQGATARVGRHTVEKLGWQLYRAESMTWPTASAAVECVLVWCRYARWIPKQFRGICEEVAARG
jgi:hypothetical protein